MPGGDGYVEDQLSRIEAKLDQLLARNSGSPGSGSLPTTPPSSPPPADTGDTGNPNWDNPPEPGDAPDHEAPAGGTPPVSSQPPVVTPPSNGGSASAHYPADICGPLWKVTIPTSTNGKVDEVKPPAFQTYTSKFFELTPQHDGIVFRVWHGGDTTQGSKNPRSELRERWDNDPEGYWNPDTGTHTLWQRGQVNRLTKVKPHVVLHQFHDSADDVYVLRLEGDKLYITNYNDTHAFLLDGAFKLGVPYEFSSTIDNGQVSFTYNGQPVSYKHPKKLTSQGYFKIGLYLQSNSGTAPGESTSEYAEVVLHSVTVSHT